MEINREEREKLLNGIKGFVDILGNIEETWNNIIDELNWCDKKELDLKHEIEADNFDVFKGYKKLMEFKEHRKYRREVKNLRELIEPLIKWHDTHKNIPIDLYKIKKTMTTTYEQQINWTYILRVPEAGRLQIKASQKKGDSNESSGDVSV